MDEAPGLPAGAAEADLERLPALGGFQQALGTAFHVGLGGGRSSELTLVAVDVDDVVTERNPPWESFALLFDGPVGEVPQGLYPVEHGQLGTFGLFLVPVRTRAGKQCYEAVFNRPKP